MTADIEPTPTYSIVVPVFESDSTITELFERLVTVFESIDGAWEVVFVDDGSQNSKTWTACRGLGESYANVRAIRLARNYGKPSAVLCGIAHSRGRWVITLDDDLQQRPEDIPALLAHRDHDVVVAHYRRRRHGPLAVIASQLKYFFDRAILRLPCKMSPLKVIKAEVAQDMLRIRTSRPFIPALLSLVTTDFKSVDLLHADSKHGTSRYTFLKRLRQLSNLLISNSSILLRFLGVIGALMSVSGFGFAVAVIARKVAGYPVQPGWSSLIVVMLVFGGLTLIGLGLIGEYLIRILDGISERPPYVIRSAIGGTTQARNDRRTLGNP